MMDVRGRRGTGTRRPDPRLDPLDNLLESSLSVGLDPAFGDKTKLFGFYTAGDIGDSNPTNDYLAVGIERNF